MHVNAFFYLFIDLSGSVTVLSVQVSEILSSEAYNFEFYCQRFLFGTVN